MSDIINEKSTTLEPIAEDRYEETKFHIIKCTNVDPNNLNRRNYSECEYMAIMQNRKAIEREKRLIKNEIILINRAREREASQSKDNTNTVDKVKKANSAPAFPRTRIVKPIVQRSLSPLAMLNQNRQRPSSLVLQ